MKTTTIEQFMTRSPHTIGHDQPLAAAHRMMNDHGIRHLPVLKAGKLVGVVSQRDLHFVETLRSTDTEEVKVSEAMSADAFTVSPRASLRKVAAEMARHKYGSAVVVKGADVVGVFTTIDALRALTTVLGPSRQAKARRRA